MGVSVKLHFSKADFVCIFNLYDKCDNINVKRGSCMKVRKSRVVILVFVLIMIIGGIYYIYHMITSSGGENEVLTFKQKEATVEYGAKVDSASFIKESKNKVIEYPSVDTLHVGEQKITYLVQVDGKQVKEPYMVSVKDTTKPVVVLKSNSLELALHAKFDPSDIIKNIEDPIDGKLPYHNTEMKNSFTIQSNVDVSKPGTYKITVRATDKNGNVNEATCSVLVEKQAVSASTDVKPMYINGILLVNKTYGLPRDFGNGLEPQVEKALRELQKGAKAAGFDMPIISGFRSYATQEQLFNDYVARDGYDKANTYSSHPGHSEHQTGLAADVGSIDDNYGSTPAGEWLYAHCADYGFIIRYMKGKEKITGYQYEPWHIRYVGKDVAKTIMDKKISLEEYLGVQN